MSRSKQGKSILNTNNRWDGNSTAIPSHRPGKCAFLAHESFREEIWHKETANSKSPFQYTAEDKYSQTQPNHSIVAWDVMEIFQPGTRGRSKGSQVHRIDDLFPRHRGLHRNGDDQRRKLLDACHQSAFEFIHFVAAGPLRIHRNHQVTREGRHETEGQIHRERDSIGCTHTLECRPIDIGIHCKWNRDGEESHG